MPTPLMKGQHILVHHGIYEEHYQMKSMQMATEHYNIGITLQGRRRTITPHFSYCYQAGDIALAPPYLFHRTVSESDGPYERIMIKFSPQFVEPFCRIMGKDVFTRLYETYVYHFTSTLQEKLKHMFWDMLAEYQKESPYREFILQGMLFRLFTIIIEEHLPIPVIKEPSMLSPKILTAIHYMDTHFNSGISMEQTAAFAGFSPAHFSRLFKAQLGMSYSTYLNHIQIRNVQALLSNTNLSITEIAARCGYSHTDYLSAQFKRITGLTPNQYRKQSALGLLPS